MEEAPDLFAAGFAAAWAAAVCAHPDMTPPFELTDAEIDRAWMIHLETREDTPNDPS